MMNAHHFHPITATTARTTPAAVPPAIAGMAADMVESVESEALRMLIEIRRVAALTLSGSNKGITKGTEKIDDR